MCMCICVYVYVCICAYVYMYICVYVYMCICAYVSVCTCAYVHMCTCVCVHVYMCICVHVYVCILGFRVHDNALVLPCSCYTSKLSRDNRCSWYTPVNINGKIITTITNHSNNNHKNNKKKLGLPQQHLLQHKEQPCCWFVFLVLISVCYFADLPARSTLDIWICTPKKN